jgi:aromatic-amino-acid transaminase
MLVRFAAAPEPMTQSALQPTPPFLIEAARTRAGDDPIFALNAMAQKRARAGEHVVNATLGALMDDEGKLAVMKTVFEAFAAVDPQRAAGYAPIAGEKGFLDAVVADLFAERSLAKFAVAAATPGGTGALHHAIVNFLEPGQALLAPEFYWGPYKTLADHTRRRVETFAMFDASRRFDCAAFERALEGQVRAQGRALVLLNTPCNNPTGYSLDGREWSDVSRIVRAAARRAPVALLVDHAYAKFGGPNSERWIEHASELAGDALLLVAWTASKSFTQYGARVGALVAVHPDEAERQRIANALGYSCRGTWSNCNHAGQLAIGRLLADSELRARADAERAGLRALLDQRVAAFNAAAGAAGIDYPRYEGGFFVSAFAPRPEVAAERMRERGVFVVPIAGALRIALCSTPARDVPKLVQALSEGLKAANP